MKSDYIIRKLWNISQGPRILWSISQAEENTLGGWEEGPTVFLYSTAAFDDAFADAFADAIADAFVDASFDASTLFVPQQT